jgi:6-phosphogluconolactonase/glucosamine-6-phosphate isomerase/deaminase
LTADSFDMSKMQIYFCNERIGANKCYKGALEAFAEKAGVPIANLHKVPEGEPADVAAQYEDMIRSDSSLDQSGPIPACDLILLGTGDVSGTRHVFPPTANNALLTQRLSFSFILCLGRSLRIPLPTIQ